MRHHARAHFELLPQLRAQFAIDAGQQIKRYHTGIGQVGIEQIADHEFDFAAGVGALRVGICFGDPLRIEINADTARAALFCGSDNDAAITAAEVIQ